MQSKDADLFMKVIIMRSNIKLLDSLACFHYILTPRIYKPLGDSMIQDVPFIVNLYNEAQYIEPNRVVHITLLLKISRLLDMLESKDFEFNSESQLLFSGVLLS